jgi:uncharacterized protein (DUF1684 family)
MYQNGGSMVQVPAFAMSIEELEKDVRAYRDARAARLTAERGWLSVINKVWLAEGSHRIGAAEGSEIQLPPGRAPAHVATLTRAGDVVTLTAAAGIELAARAGSATVLVLRSDRDPNPDRVAYGPFSFELLEREGDFALRVRDAQNPARLAFRGVPAYPVDLAFRIEARLERYAIEREVVLEDGDGRPQLYAAPGLAVFELRGGTYRLEPVFESNRKRLFILFADDTNRDTTYGAGRFLYAALAAGDSVLLDFNKAFNPPCAFTPYAVCPLPAPENRLPLRVEAGEMRPSVE